MALNEQSKAVKLAWAQVEAWTTHDFAAARARVADNAQVVVTTTQSQSPTVNAVVNTIGVDEYMSGLESFAQALTPGSLEKIAALGDDRHALIMFTVEADYGGGKFRLPNARMIMLNDDEKIVAEQVAVFTPS